MELIVEGGIMAVGWGARVEGRATSLRMGVNPGLWGITIHLSPGPFCTTAPPNPHCPQTSPSPVTSRWPEGQSTGKSHWKDIGWLTGTQCAWWLSHDTLFPFWSHLSLYSIAFLQSSPVSSVCIHSPFAWGYLLAPPPLFLS